MKINQSWFQRTWVEQFHFLRLLLYFFGDFFTYRVMRRLLWQCWSCCYWWGHYWCSRSAWNWFEIWARLTNTWWTVWIDNSMLCIWHNWASWLWTEKRKHIFSISVWNKTCMIKRALYFRYKNILDFKKIFSFLKNLPNIGHIPIPLMLIGFQKWFLHLLLWFGPGNDTWLDNAYCPAFLRGIYWNARPIIFRGGMLFFLIFNSTTFVSDSFFSLFWWFK